MADKKPQPEPEVMTRDEGGVETMNAPGSTVLTKEQAEARNQAAEDTISEGDLNALHSDSPLLGLSHSAIDQQRYAHTQEAADFFSDKAVEERAKDQPEYDEEKHNPEPPDIAPVLPPSDEDETAEPKSKTPEQKLADQTPKPS